MHFFTDEYRHPYFHANNLWLDIAQVRQAMIDRGGVLELPLIRNEKTVDPTDKARVLTEFMRREASPIAPIAYGGGTAPVHEVVMTGDDVDLGKLPVQQHCEGDSGRYVTIGCMICRDPASGVTNVGTYRHELKGPARMGCMMNPVQHAATIRGRHRPRRGRTRPARGASCRCWCCSRPN